MPERKVTRKCRVRASDAVPVCAGTRYHRDQDRVREGKGKRAGRGSRLASQGGMIVELVTFRATPGAGLGRDPGRGARDDSALAREPRNSVRKHYLLSEDGRRCCAGLYMLAVARRSGGGARRRLASGGLDAADPAARQRSATSNFRLLLDNAARHRHANGRRTARSPFARVLEPKAGLRITKASATKHREGIAGGNCTISTANFLRNLEFRAFLSSFRSLEISKTYWNYPSGPRIYCLRHDGRR